MTAPLLAVEGLTFTYPPTRRLFARARPGTPAVADVGFTLQHGSMLALLGESGSGKSTLTRLLLRLLEPEAGTAHYRSTSASAPRELFGLGPRALRAVRGEIGLVLQDPLQSLNPRLVVGEAVAEPLLVHGLAWGREARLRAAAMLARVGLPAGCETRFPHEFSGGQRQRVALARALVARPRLLVLDEALSALDVSVRAQMLNLLLELRRELAFSALFITHDLALARALADEVVVLEGGRVVERGPAATVLAEPAHPATRRLLAAELAQQLWC